MTWTQKRFTKVLIAVMAFGIAVGSATRVLVPSSSFGRIEETFEFDASSVPGCSDTGLSASDPATATGPRPVLGRGLNLSHWFSQVFEPGGYTAAYLSSHTTDRDLELIQLMGFDHVRLPVDPQPLFDPQTPGVLDPVYLVNLDKAIGRLLERGLTVVVDLHPTDAFKRWLNEDNGHVHLVAEFWEALAGHLSRYDPRRLVLEALNEPMVGDRLRWEGVQARLIHAIRRGAPHHTIIATGANWSDVDDLLSLEPLNDPGVIYSFHMYEPLLFTHQGSDWGTAVWSQVRGVPYPSSPESVRSVEVRVGDEGAREALVGYGRQRWDGSKLDARVAEVAAWARRHGVRVICPEFGVYRPHAPRQARLAWLRDVRRSLERHGIGWTMWDYAGGFGVVERDEDGTPLADPQLTLALGMRPRDIAWRLSTGLSVASSDGQDGSK